MNNLNSELLRNESLDHLRIEVPPSATSELLELLGVFVARHGGAIELSQQQEVPSSALAPDYVEWIEDSRSHESIAVVTEDKLLRFANAVGEKATVVTRWNRALTRTLQRTATEHTSHLAQTTDGSISGIIAQDLAGIVARTQLEVDHPSYLDARGFSGNSARFFDSYVTAMYTIQQ